MVFDSDPDSLFPSLKDDGPIEATKCRTVRLNRYRLPTVHEAERFSLPESPTFVRIAPESFPLVVPFPWGKNSDLIVRFGRTAENAKGRTWPAGTTLPNSRGIFDSIGSLLEWTITFSHGGAYGSGGNLINADPTLFHVQPIAIGRLTFSNFYWGARLVRTLPASEQSAVE